MSKGLLVVFVNSFAGLSELVGIVFWIVPELREAEEKFQETYFLVR